MTSHAFKAQTPEFGSILVIVIITIIIMLTINPFQQLAQFHVAVVLASFCPKKYLRLKLNKWTWLTSCCVRSVCRDNKYFGLILVCDDDDDE